MRSTDGANETVKSAMTRLTSSAGAVMSMQPIIRDVTGGLRGIRSR